jgi:hypothetical protein
VGGALVGGATGAFLGGLGGWGVHHHQISHYENQIRQGKVLVIAHGDPLQLVAADRMLKETEAAEVHVHAKTSSESPEVSG